MTSSPPGNPRRLPVTAPWSEVGAEPGEPATAGREGSSTPLSYVEIPPLPELAPWIAALWSFGVHPAAGEIEHRIPLTGSLVVAVRRDEEPMLVGPRVAPLSTLVRGGDVFWGIQFWPGAARSLLHLPPGSLRDEQGPARLWLDADWCRSWSLPPDGDLDAGVVARLDAALLALVPRAAPLDAPVMTAVFRLIRSRGLERVEELARAVNLSPRQLRRRFHAAVGLSPKELARVRRLRATAAEAVLGHRPWAEVAAEGGYADQAHLVREFRRLMGASPSAFERHARRIDHRLLPE